MMIYEGKVMDEFSLKVLNPELYQQGVCYMNILYKSKLHLEGNNPLMTATRKYYVPVNNRVSAPIPEEFFPETWFQLCDRTDLTQSS
jgi:hypothetical protein